MGARSSTDRGRRAHAPVLFALALLAAGCSTGSSDDAAGTTTSAGGSGTTVSTTDGAAEDGVFGRPPPELGDQPERVTESPLQLELPDEGGDPVGGGSDGAPSNLRSIRRSPAAPANGPVRLRPSGGSGWHEIPKSSKGQSEARVGTEQHVYPDGTERLVEWPSGRVTEFGPDGSVRIEEPDGGFVEFGPGGGSGSAGPGQGFHTWGPDGSESHLDDKGYREKDADGTIRNYDEDGGSTEVPPPVDPGGSEVDPDGTEEPDSKPGADDPDSETEVPDDPEGSESPESQVGEEVPDPPTIPDQLGEALGGLLGEPHYLTADGAAVTTQALGEVVLATGVDGQELQARTEPYDGSPSVAAVSALAFGVDDQRVVVSIDGIVAVDGTAAPDGDALQFALDDGGAVGVWRDPADDAARDVVVVWADGSRAWVTVHPLWLDLRLSWAEATGDRTGVLGSDDGDDANDLATRDGDVLDPSADQPATDEAVHSWQVSDDESLFDYADGESTATFIDADFPTEPADPDLASSADACDDVAEGFARESCRYDVAVTGDDAFAEAAESYGAHVAGDAARRALFEQLLDVLSRLTAGATSGDGPDGGGSDDEPAATGDGIEITAADRDGAEDTEAGAAVAADLDGDASRTYRFEVTETSTLGAFSDALECPGDPFVPGEAGYAFFDEEGTVVSGPSPACDDDPGKATLEPGTYYLKLVGPGAVGVDPNLFPTG